MNTYIFFIVMSLSGFIQCRKQPLVHGGFKVTIEEYPHVMALHVMCNELSTHKKKMYICGASILTTKLALTAAHCINLCNFTSSIYSVTAGSNTLREGFKSTIKGLYIHKKYGKRDMGYDISLLRLKTEMKFSDKMKPVIITAYPPYNETALLAAWGSIQLKHETERPKYLFAIYQDVLSEFKCNKFMGGRLTPRYFCGDSNFEETYVTKGDSGSALVVRDNIQIGICSFGIPSVRKSMEVYTKVTYFKKWIKKHARMLSRL
ncbi:chymotrypsin-1-like [Spodoptera litura]|uniref:Chymotrypsin-1-like n=1 Tax=Spodoptera litura TaxID=69820 RepID=A0A9J7IKG8_SPOLT|nr:chymotrypsin-1-like [Spodoptera litura]